MLIFDLSGCGLCFSSPTHNYKRTASSAALYILHQRLQHSESMALRGLKVVEMAGLAPAPLAGMILAGKIIDS